MVRGSAKGKIKEFNLEGTSKPGQMPWMVGGIGASCFLPWSRDRCGLYQNLDVSWTNLTLLWFSCVGGSRTGRG